MKTRSLVASLAACLAIAGCSDDNEYFGEKYSLTVFAYNGVTGEPVVTADLASGIVIYQGADKVTPVALDSGVAGAVIFNGLEADYVGGNKVFPIRAKINGYQDFKGLVSFAVNYDPDQPLRDDVYAQVGYITLWPVNYHAPDYTFTVLYNGQPVPNAAVLFGTDQQNRAGGTNGVIVPVFTPVAALSGTTDANGRVTFAGTSLVLDAYYDAEVLPLTFNGVALPDTTVTNIRVGYASPDRVINMTSPDTSLTHGLFVKTVSPSKGAVQSNGVLTLTFNMPVTASSLFAGDTEFSVTAAGYTTPPTPGTRAVTATLSADGLTLTLAPNFTDAGTPGAGANLTYAGGANAFVVAGYPNDAINLSDLYVGGLGTNGYAISNYLIVTVAAP